MDGIEEELDKLVSEAEQVVAAARQRRDAFRKRLIQKQQDAKYLCDLATWLERATATRECAGDTDCIRLREIAARLQAIVLQE